MYKLDLKVCFSQINSTVKYLNLFTEIFLRIQTKNSHKHYQAMQGHLKLGFVRKFIGSCRSQIFFKIGVLKNFAIFARKHLCWSLFLIYWKEIPTQVCLPVNIAKFLGTSFLKNICGGCVCLLIKKFEVSVSFLNPQKMSEN